MRVSYYQPRMISFQKKPRALLKKEQLEEPIFIHCNTTLERKYEKGLKTAHQQANTLNAKQNGTKFGMVEETSKTAELKMDQMLRYSVEGKNHFKNSQWISV